MTNKLGREMVARRNELALQVETGELTESEAIQSLAGWLLKRDDFPPGQLTHGQTRQENALLNAQTAFAE